ncbi:MAG TPA: hypothetical protein VF916_04780 [Ktedonobacterales bacterium]
MSAEHNEDANVNETPHAVVWLPLEDIGLDPRPLIRRVRPVDPVRLDKYVNERRPVETWTPLAVRHWPARDPYPPDEQGKTWQVIGGTHCTLAARRLGGGWSRLPAIVRDDIVEDADFVVLATTHNFHGKEMDDDSLHKVALYLRDECGLSVGDIAKRMQIAKGTVQDWLKPRQRSQAGGSPPGGRREGEEALPVERDGWQGVAPAQLDPKRLMAVQRALNSMLTSIPNGNVTPAEIKGYLAQLTPDMRDTMHAQLLAGHDLWTNVFRAFIALYGDLTAARAARHEE